MVNDVKSQIKAKVGIPNDYSTLMWENEVMDGKENVMD